MEFCPSARWAAGRRIGAFSLCVTRLADAPVDAVSSIQELALDEGTSELAVIGPELAQDGVDFRLGQPLARWKRSYHLGQNEPPAAFASRPLEDPPVAPERAQLPHLLGSRVPTCGGHAPL